MLEARGREEIPLSGSLPVLSIRADKGKQGGSIVCLQDDVPGNQVSGEPGTPCPQQALHLESWIWDVTQVGH